MSAFFLRPYLLVLILLAVPIVIGWARRQISIRHPHLEPHKALSGRSLLTTLGCVFLTGMILSTNLALMGPKVPNAVVEHKALIRKVCIAVDRSGSMDTELEDGAKELADIDAKTKDNLVDNGSGDKLVMDQSKSDEGESEGKIKRIKGAEIAARFLIKNRMTDNPAETDHFCLMMFDDDTYMLAPLSSDKRTMLLRSRHIGKETSGGTNFAGPYGYTSGTGPLQKAIDFFSENTGPNSTAVLVLITDGEDSIPDERRKQLVELFVQHKLNFYVIGVGDSWKNKDDLDLQKFANELNKINPKTGVVFKAANPGEMQKAMAKINELEKAAEIVETRQEYREIYGWFLLAAGIFGGLFIAVAVAARRVP